MRNLQAYNAIASGITDTAGNLAYHVQEPDPGQEGIMKKNKEKKGTVRRGEIWWEKAGLKSWHSSGHSHETDKSEKVKTPIFFFCLLPPSSPPQRGPMKVPFVSQMSLCCDKLRNN